MATELVLLGTAGAPLPVAGRGGISSALIVDERVFVIDCGRGSPSAFAAAGLDFSRLEAVFLTHLHADHIGDLPGMILYPWGVRAGGYGPLRAASASTGRRDPKRCQPAMPPSTARRRSTRNGPPRHGRLVESILAGYAYHLNVMPLDAPCRTQARSSGGSTSAVPARAEGIARFRSSSSKTARSGSPPSR